MELEKQIRVLRLDVRTRDVLNALVRVVGELELTDAARGSRQPEIVLGTGQIPVLRQRLQTLSRLGAAATGEVEQAKLERRVAAGGGRGKWLEAFARLIDPAFEDVEKGGGQLARRRGTGGALHDAPRLVHRSTAERGRDLLRQRLRRGARALRTGGRGRKRQRADECREAENTGLSRSHEHPG